jgi:predicted enzyme related to lactoylglutathione lyase
VKLGANLIMVNLPSDEPTKTADFYASLLGIDMVPGLGGDSETFHAPISEDGIDLTVNPQHAREERPTPFYAVDDLDEAVASVKRLGGQVVWGPEDIPIDDKGFQGYKQIVEEEWHEKVTKQTMGRGLIAVEPGGTHVGLIDLAEHAHGHFAHGRYRKELSGAPGIDVVKVRARKRS